MPSFVIGDFGVVRKVRLTVVPAREVQRLCEHFGFEASEVTGPRKLQAVVSKRRVVARCLRDSAHSYPGIGKALGRDSSAIMCLLGASPGTRRGKGL